MDADSLTRIAGLIGESGRIRMLTIMLDGNGHPASELAVAADVSAQTASSHLAKLLKGGLIVSERRGRQRLFQLKDTDVAVAVEALGALATQKTSPHAMPELRFARTCYDHLAGALSIAMRDDLLRRGLLRTHQDDFILTQNGEHFVGRLGVDVASLRALRRAFARKCMDWTERHHHIGGAVGAALLTRFFEMKWIARMRESRAVRITEQGERQFENVFGIRCSALRSR